MRSNGSWIAAAGALLLLSTWVLPAAAANGQARGKAGIPHEGKKTEASKPVKGRKAPAPFRPSEKIGADQAVAFPVDI